MQTEVLDDTENNTLGITGEKIDTKNLKIRTF